MWVIFFTFKNRLKSALTAAAFARLWFLCLVINKRLWNCWWGGLTVQLHACTGRSEEWLELRWAEKCSLARLQNRWEGTKGKVRGGLGEGDSACRESRVNLIHKVDGLEERGVVMNKKMERIEGKASLCAVGCVAVRWGLFTLTHLTCELILPAG